MTDIDYSIDKYKVEPHNGGVYMDIGKDMLAQKSGVFTFIIRVDGKKIVDYVQMETINYGGRDN